ncbi:MAG TPA: CAP domain-containing protein [Candidatus Elarobacter sp.]|nr:CAP domain-containing protein [Candidatus Elarobacter sp.]
MKVLTRRERASTAAMTLALAGAFIASSISAAAAAPEGNEAPMSIAFVNPHYPQSATDQAKALTNDVNAERLKRGIPALVIDESLNRFAYAKASEMASRGYFGHTDPDGITFVDRLRAWHYSAPYAAENIAFDRDELHAHAAFMHSAPHAANLLDPHERRMGVAVVTVGVHDTFYVEVFSS